MRNLKLILSYDGADFSGWQVQPDAITVQGTLASAIGRITGEKVLPQGSGRTDAGVHALAQVMTFVTESSVPTANFLKALNDILPASVRVLEVDEKRRRIFMRGIRRGRRLIAIGFIGKRSVRRFWRDMCGIILIRWRKRRWREAARLVVGEHDFTSFAAVDPERGQRRTRRPSVTVSHPCRLRTIFSRPGSRDGRGICLYGKGVGISASHGAKSGGTFILVGKGTLQGGGCDAHPCSPQPVGGGRDGSGQWDCILVERGVLSDRARRQSAGIAHGLGFIHGD